MLFDASMRSPAAHFSSADRVSQRRSCRAISHTCKDTRTPWDACSLACVCTRVHFIYADISVWSFTSAVWHQRGLFHILGSPAAHVSSTYRVSQERSCRTISHTCKDTYSRRDLSASVCVHMCTSYGPIFNHVVLQVLFCNCCFAIVVLQLLLCILCFANVVLQLLFYNCCFATAFCKSKKS